jgi:hypothetical protein
VVWSLKEDRRGRKGRREGGRRKEGRRRREERREEGGGREGGGRRGGGGGRRAPYNIFVVFLHGLPLMIQVMIENNC